MSRILLLTTLLLGARVAGAQDAFIAPSQSTILASSEESFGSEPAHQLYVTNRSTVPVIVFGISLTRCENVKQSCGGRPLKIAVPAGQRRNVYRVQPKDDEKGFEYRWSFSYRADSSDAKAIAALRAHGIHLDGPSPASNTRPVAVAPTVPSRTDVVTSPPPTLPPGAVRDGSPEHLALIREYDAAHAAERATAPVSLRFKLGYGSILGSTMMPGAPVQPTGACVDPAQSAKYERDGRITRNAWRPPVMARISTLRLPAAFRDSIAKPGDLLVRFVVDTSGKVIPESVTVLESPHGQLSVRGCTTVMGTPAKPARDEQGRPILAWVQMPISASSE